MAHYDDDIARFDRATAAWPRWEEVAEPGDLWQPIDVQALHVVPEPAAVTALWAGALALAHARRRRRVSGCTSPAHAKVGIRD